MSTSPNSLNDFLNASPLSESTRATYKRLIQLFLKECANVSNLTSQQFLQWLDHHNWGSNMRWLAFCAVKKYLRWYYGNGHPALLLRIKRIGSSPQRVLNADQVKRLLDSFGKSPTDVRDKAIAALLLDTGLRASEICRLETRYMDFKRRELSVIIKGGKWGSAVFSEYTRQLIIEWLLIRNRYAKPDCRYLFCGIRGTTPGEKLTVFGLRCIMRKWGRRAGIGALSPHDFRRTFATLAIQLGAPTRLVQVAGRWSDIEMVERYTRTIKAQDFDPYSPVMAVMTG